MEKLNKSNNSNKNGNQQNPKNFKLLLIICISSAVLVIAAIIGITVATSAIINNGNTQETTISDISTEQPTTESTTIENAAAANSGIDNEMGLRNVKVDSNSSLTDDQKAVAQYFDNDYLDITSYEFLARYPSIFEGTQIYFSGTVQKIISSTDTDYEMLVWVGKSEAQFYYRSGNIDQTYEEHKEKTKSNLIIIKGKQTTARLIVGDEVVVYGRYDKISTNDIDGTSYTIPTVHAYRTFTNTSLGEPQKFDADFIKQVSKSIFGNDIEVRNATDGEDYDSEAGSMNCTFIDNPFMICEPENQSNSRFTKYRMFMTQGIIEDAKSASTKCKTGTEADESTIIRNIEFTADFEHYLVYTFDTSLNNMSVGYYDKDFKKIWQRDFEETINGIYDYTSKNFYIVANNDLYIIDMATGEDTVKPSYVGEKIDIRKVEDGIIMFSQSKADSVMKTDLDGNIVWKTNIMNDNYATSTQSVQFVDKKIIVSNNFVSFEFNADTGELVTTGELQSNNVPIDENY